MSGDKTLVDRLGALARETPDFADGARILDAADALGSLLDEIDATILPATLRFDNGSAQLMLEVAGRRLHRIADASGSLPAPDDLIGKSLSMEDDALIGQAAQFIATFAGAATTLTVRSDPPRDGLAESPDSVSIHVLARTLGLDDPDLSPRDAFVAALEDAALASIRIRGGAVASSSGEAKRVAALRIVLNTQLPHFLRKRRETCASHADPSLTWLADVAGEGVGIAVVALEDETLLAELRFDDLIALLPRLRRMLR